MPAWHGMGSRAELKKKSGARICRNDHNYIGHNYRAELKKKSGARICRDDGLTFKIEVAAIGEIQQVKKRIPFLNTTMFVFRDTKDGPMGEGLVQLNSRYETTSW